MRQKDVDKVSLIDGSVLVNAPFSEAMGALQGRPAQREVDRRFVYIDPRPDRRGRIRPGEDEEVGFFRAIIGSVSAIPREQPIRDNLEVIQAQSREAERLGLIVAALRPEVERTVDRIFGRTFFIDRPSRKRLGMWRAKAQQAAAEQAGYAFHSYAQAKFAGVVERLAQLIFEHAPGLLLHDPGPIAERLREELEARGLTNLVEPLGGATEETMLFFRQHDIGFRIRRLRLLARRLSIDWEDDPEIAEADRDAAREMIYKALALYFEREGSATLEKEQFRAGGREGARRSRRGARRAGRNARADRARRPGRGNARPRAGGDAQAAQAADAVRLSRLPVLRHRDPAAAAQRRPDRVRPDQGRSHFPDDAVSIRLGGTLATLRGVEFYNFGAFFSRAYRENDYLWGRLHGAERMIDLVCSTVEGAVDDKEIAGFKQRIFLAILDEEEHRLTTDKTLVPQIRNEVLG